MVELMSQTTALISGLCSARGTYSDTVALVPTSGSGLLNAQMLFNALQKK